MLGFLKGRIDIRLAKKQFRIGEKVEGTLFVKTKKPLMSDGLYVRLCAYSGDHSTSVRWGSHQMTSAMVKIYSFALPLQGERPYRSGAEEGFTFSLTVPTTVLKDILPESAERVLGTVLKWQRTVFNRSIIWYVEGQLSIPKSTDIRKKVKIEVLKD